MKKNTKLLGLKRLKNIDLSAAKTTKSRAQAKMAELFYGKLKKAADSLDFGKKVTVTESTNDAMDSAEKSVFKEMLREFPLM